MTDLLTLRTIVVTVLFVTVVLVGIVTAARERR
jgi:hypothetical protein